MPVKQHCLTVFVFSVGFCFSGMSFFNNLDKILMFHYDFDFCVSLFTFIFFSFVKEFQNKNYETCTNCKL